MELVGRHTALAALETYATAEEPTQLAILWGPAGIGKSSVLYRFAEDLGPQRSQVIDLETIVSGAAHDPIRALMDDIVDASARWCDGIDQSDYARVATRADEAELAVLLSQPTVAVTQRAIAGSIVGSPVNVRADTKTADLTALRAVFRTRLLAALTRMIARCTPTQRVLILDSYEQLDTVEDNTDEHPAPRHDIGGGQSWLTKQFLPALARTGLRIVVAGWNEIHPPIPAVRIELGEWSAQHSQEYLAARGLSDTAMATAVFRACGGHPAWTALVADACVAGAARGVPVALPDIPDIAANEPADRWIVPLFLDRLPPRQRAIVLTTSVLREVTISAVTQIVSGATQQMVYPDWAGELLGHSFVQRIAQRPDDETRFRFHRLVRDGLIKRFHETEPNNAAAAHQAAAAYFHQRSDLDEEIYHRFAAGDVGPAQAWTRELMNAEKGFTYFRLRTLVDLALRPEVAHQLRHRSPDVLFEAYFAAHSVYFEDHDRRARVASLGYALAQQEGNSLEIANFSVLRATSAIEAGDLEAVDTLLTDADARYQALGNPLGRFTVLGNIAWLQEARGDLPAAHHTYTRQYIYALLNGPSRVFPRPLAMIAATSPPQYPHRRIEQLLGIAAFLAENVGDHLALRDVFVLRARLARDGGDRVTERQHLDTARRTVDLSVDPASANGTIELSLARSFAADQAWIQAAHYARTALSKLDLDDRPQAILCLVQSLIGLQQLPEAITWLDSIEADSPEFDSAVWLPALLQRMLLFDRYDKRGDVDDAANVLLAAATRVEEVARRADPSAPMKRVCAAAIAAFARLGHALTRTGQDQGALGVVSSTLLALGHALGDPDALGHGYLYLAVTMTGTPDHDQTVIEILHHAIEQFSGGTDANCKAISYQVLGQHHDNHGRTGDARAALHIASQLWSELGEPQLAQRMLDLAPDIDAAPPG